MTSFDGIDDFHVDSRWSERHAAYACGLGTFGLSRGLITEYEFIVPEEKMPDLSSKRIIRPFKPGEEHYVAEAHERICRDRFRSN